ncbi:MAG: UPF0149 family protein, partial [Kangiellaceae bacterium]
MNNFDIKSLENHFKQENIKQSFEELYHCLGFIVSVASCPEMIEPHEWIDELIITKDGKPRFINEKQVHEITENLIAWWSDCNTRFEDAETLELPKSLGLTATGKPNKKLVNFALGYLDAFEWLSKCWQARLSKEDDEANRTVAVLNFIMARFINEKSMREEEPEMIKQLPNMEGCVKVLPNLISGVGILGKDLYLDAQIETPV